MGADSREPDSLAAEDGRLESWKEIATYLNRHVTTVRRWEKQEGLPVHRHVHDRLGSVYAFRAELDAWWRSRRVQLEQGQEAVEDVPSCPPLLRSADHGASSEARGETPISNGNERDPGVAQSKAPDGGSDRLTSESGPRVAPPRTFQGRGLLIAAAAVALCVMAAGAVSVMFSGLRTDTRHPDITSLAVLPLENLSGDPGQEYLADGITEALIGQLAQVRALRIVSRTSVMAFKGSRRPLPEIARALRVDAVVQGSVQRSGDRVRVRVRLIDGRTDTHLWARDYDSESKDGLKLEAALAQAVGEEIRIQVTAEERARMASAADVDPAAHQEYLIGRYYLWRDTDEALQRAIGHFERATAIDPQYAAAYASLAHARWKQGLWGHDLSGAESPARAAAQTALQLDGRLAEAYVVQADLERLYARNMARAEEFVTRALMFDANSVDAHYTYALVLMTLGRFEEAVQQMESAERLDPLSPAVQSDFGRVLYRARRYDEAIVRLNRALDLEPTMGWLVHARLAEVYEQMGHYDRAMAALRQAGDEGRSYDTQVARVLARMGHHREAKALLKDIEADPSRLSRNAIAIAGVYAALGDNDKAFALLFDQIERGDPGPNFVAVDPPFDSLHRDPRWNELVRRVNGPRGTVHAFQ